MEDKDVALLGFISSAQKYIEEHQNDETKLLGLDNLNLKSLKEELVKQLKFFDDKEKVETLMNDGSAAFSQYINDLSAKENALNVLSDIFSTSFDDEEDLTDKNSNQKIKVPENMDAVIKEVVDNEKPKTKNNKKKEHEPLSKTLKSFASEKSKDKSDSKDEEIEKNENQSSKRPNSIIENPGLKLQDYDEENEEQDLDELEKLAEDKQTKVNNKIAIPDELIDRIRQVYPYLDASFVESAYSLRQEINYYYSIYKVVIVLHRISFKDVDRLREFVEIVTDHDYFVNVDERQMIVDVIKSINNEEGAILTNIFTIANQAKCVEGEYVGYRVMNNDKK